MLEPLVLGGLLIARFVAYNIGSATTGRIIFVQNVVSILATL